MTPLAIERPPDVHLHPLEERYHYRHEGVWSPLRQPVFRALWAAALVSNIGTNIQDVAGQIYTKGASTSAVWPALVQTATLLPMAAFAFIAGAAADVFGSRRVVLIAQCWMLVAASLLAVVAWSNHLTPARFLGFTLLLNVGQAIATPAMFAVVPEMVLPRRDGQAYALNSLAFNSARAVGPLVAGFVIVSWGLGAAFICNAVSFVAVIAVLARWHNRPATHTGVSLRGAISQGAGALLAEDEFRSVLKRGAAFGVFGVALFALLPSVQRGTPPMDYGRLLSFFGIGIVLAIEIIGPAQRRLGLARTTIFACALLGVSAATVAFSDGFVLRVALVGAGIAWLIANSTLVTDVKGCVRDEERGRAMALYFVVLFLAMGTSAPVLGRIADLANVGPRRCLAAAGLALVALSAWQLVRSTPIAEPTRERTATSSPHSSQG